MADVERERVTALWREAAATFATEDDPFTDDALLRLAASSQDYYQSHGHYVPPLALRLHAMRAECGRLREQLDAARRALEFYADPLTYFAIGIFPDNPAGEFMDDFSEVPWPDGGTNVKPGKRARAALGVEGEQEDPQ